MFLYYTFEICQISSSDDQRSIYHRFENDLN